MLCTDCAFKCTYSWVKACLLHRELPAKQRPCATDNRLCATPRHSKCMNANYYLQDLCSYAQLHRPCNGGRNWTNVQQKLSSFATRDTLEQWVHSCRRLMRSLCATLHSNALHNRHKLRQRTSGNNFRWLTGNMNNVYYPLYSLLYNTLNSAVMAAQSRLYRSPHCRC